MPFQSPAGLKNVSHGAEIALPPGVPVPPPTPFLPQATASGPSTAGPRSCMGASSLANKGKGGKNQDAFVASGSGSKSLVGVFDGHGEEGERVSDFARTQITKAFFNHKDLHTNPAAALESAYLDTQHQIVNSRSFNPMHSGTTAVAAYRHRDRLVIANVGDSRAVLGCCDSSCVDSGQSGSGLKAVEVSSDHKPTREDERRRIIAEGGSVHQSAYPVRQGYGAPPKFIRVGPERVWDKSGCCGLAVTRSLGDVAMHPFVTSKPEVSERQLSSKDRVLVLGSDGVWDHVGSQEAVDIAGRHRDPTAAAREITNVARQRWHSVTQGQMSDDITAVVMHLDHGSPPPTRSSSTPSGRRSNAESLMNGTGRLKLGNSQRFAAFESLRSTSNSRAGRSSAPGRARRNMIT